MSLNNKLIKKYHQTVNAPLREQSDSINKTTIAAYDTSQNNHRGGHNPPKLMTSAIKKTESMLDAHSILTAENYLLTAAHAQTHFIRAQVTRMERKKYNQNFGNSSRNLPLQTRWKGQGKDGSPSGTNPRINQTPAYLDIIDSGQTFDSRTLVCLFDRVVKTACGLF